MQEETRVCAQLADDVGRVGRVLGRESESVDL
jgi:hypothetical protein